MSTSAVPPVTRRRAPFIAGLLLFFVCAMIPCLAITLATQGEIVIPTGGAPGEVVRVWLVMDARQRGIGISSPRILSSGENALCVQTNVSYVLWQGSGDSTVYCECYTRPTVSNSWEFTEVIEGECSPR